MSITIQSEARRVPVRQRERSRDTGSD